jgi:hypothetical protein
MAWFWRYVSFEPVKAHVIRDWRPEWRPGWESNSGPVLKTRKLLILCIAKYAGNAKNAAVGYAAGTRDHEVNFVPTSFSGDIENQAIRFRTDLSLCFLLDQCKCPKMARFFS